MQDAGLLIGYTGGGTFVGPPDAAAERMATGKEDIDTTELLGGTQLRAFGRAVLCSHARH